MRERNLLVVDWDYFFIEDIKRYPMFYDWGHRESMFFIEAIWGTRAASFLAHDIPLPRMTNLHRSFWSRFTFAPKTQCYVAESNAWAAHSDVYGRRHWDNVWLFDAHHDAGYKKKAWEILKAPTLDCGEWAASYIGNGATHHVRFPRWKTWWQSDQGDPSLADLFPERIDLQLDDELPVQPTFNRIFICRSGAWTPPWFDSEFFRFIRDCPVSKKIVMHALAPREFSWAAARQDAHKLKILLKNPSTAPKIILGKKGGKTAVKITRG